MKSLKKPVCISLNDEQLARIDSRATQTGMNRSKQLQRDLTAYWSLIDSGMLRAKNLLSVEDAQYLSGIFKGKLLPPSDDILWAEGRLSRFIMDSAIYGEDARSNKIAKLLSKKSDRFVIFALMDWLRRSALNQDDPTLYDGWKSEREK